MNSCGNYEDFWNKVSEGDENLILDNINFLRSENRSSTIFPIFKNASTKTIVGFLSYWLKKHGNVVVARFIVRDLSGKELCSNYQAIISYRSFSIIASDFIKSEADGFCGSIEVEIFSKNKPLYTYPAITVSYSNDTSCSVTHSCIRTYNKGEINTDYALKYPQTGFDVNFEEGNKNYICFFGGESKSYKIRIDLLEGNVSRSYTWELRNERYGQSHLLYLEDIIPKEDIPIFKSPKCTIHHNLCDVFPRFYVGICHQSFVPTLTHTFFDTSKEESGQQRVDMSNLRAKNTRPAELFDAAFSVPIYPIGIYETMLCSYGQNLSFSGVAIASLYTKDGDVLFSRELSNNELVGLCGMGRLNLCKFVKEAGGLLDETYSLHIAFFDEKKPFPKRFKLGLNVKDANAVLGSNICFSPLVLSENTIAKPFNRRWFPIGGPQGYSASIHNTSLKKSNSNDLTECELEFISHSGESIAKRINLRDNGAIFINPNEDESLSTLLGNEGGWCMVTSNTYLCDAYFFSMSAKQIGGDHAF